MRRIFSYLFLVLFLAIYLRPYLPYIDYYINQKYIGEELCENKDKPAMQCHGKCHLKKEIKKVTNEQDAPLFPSKNSNKERQITFLYVKNSKAIFNGVDQLTNHYFHYKKHQSFPHLIDIFNPPRA